MKSKRVLALLVFSLISILFLSGCGGFSLPFFSAGQDAPAEGEDSGIVDDGPFSTPDQLTENWINFRAFVRVIKTAEWEYDGGELRIIYNFEGQENVSGVSAGKITVNAIRSDGSQEGWSIWVDENGEIVQAVLGGEFLSAEESEALKLMSAHPLATFAAEEWDPDYYRDFKQTLAGQQVPGWELVSFDRTRGRIDGKPVDLYKVELINQEGFGPEVAVYEYGDFGPFLLILGVKHSYSDFQTKSITFR